MVGVFCQLLADLVICCTLLGVFCPTVLIQKKELVCSLPTLPTCIIVLSDRQSECLFDSITARGWWQLLPLLHPLILSDLSI